MRAWLVIIRGEKSQQEMAWDIGISQGYYASLESGKRDPSVNLAKHIAKIYDFPWPVFFDEKGRVPSQIDQEPK